jgi:nucleotide-binding universal stress UspA family protein
MYTRIAVPLDGTTESELAIAQAVGLARRSGAAVELITAALPAWTTDVSHVPAGRDSLWLHNASRYLEHEATHLGADITATTTVLEGPAEDELADYLEASTAELIVMATHDRSRIERLLNRSVTAQVMRNTTKPIFVVHAGRSDVAPSLDIDRILVALDGSPFADQILAHAAELATLMKAELTLLTVVPPLLAIARDASLGESMLGIGELIQALPTDEESAERGHQWLEARAGSLRALGLAVTTDVALHAHAGRALTSYAEKHAIDVIALSTNGRGALKRLVMGSVATHVLHGSRTRLLVLRPSTAMPTDHARPIG